MSDSDLDNARSETVADIAGCLCRLSRANHLLTLAQRVALAEIARDLADSFDEGKVLASGDVPRRRRFIKTDHDRQTPLNLVENDPIRTPRS
jgi:hypothetical protein